MKSLQNVFAQVLRPHPPCPGAVLGFLIAFKVVFLRSARIDGKYVKFSQKGSALVPSLEKSMSSKNPSPSSLSSVALRRRKLLRPFTSGVLPRRLNVQLFL